MHSDLQPQGLSRARALGRLLEKTWRSGTLARPDFDTLRTRADRIASHDGGGTWRDACERLLHGLQSEAQLNAIGLTFAYAQIARLLEQRRRAAMLWAERPEIAAVPLAQPIIVLGHMRSGTTRLQRLLGCDPRLNHTRFFEVTTPVPPALDWRMFESWAQLRLIHFLNPEIQAVHPTSARAVDEVFGLLAFSFYGAQFEAQWRVPAFARWWEGQDRGWVYAELKRLLQTIAWQRRASSGPWVLKAPQFMEDLEPLLAMFPDARLACLTREPGEVVPSTASLAYQQMQVQSDTVDQHWIGQEWLRKTARREALCAEVRSARPDVPQIDVTFAAMNGDWRAEMRRIYDFLDIDLTSEVERRMASYLRRAEASGFRGHRYRAGDFGLDQRAIGAALSTG